MIVAGGPQSEARSTNGVGSVDCSMDGKAGRSDEATLIDLARSSIGVLLGLAGICENLSAGHGLGAHRLRHGLPR